MTQPMTREQDIQNEALTIIDGLYKDPFFYAAKQNARRNLSWDSEGRRVAPPVIIEITEEADGKGAYATVVDEDPETKTLKTYVI